ncbi:unnamed protein product [Parascedosporium putredinis]|uniref:Uncharacterized protein n=1 Tax=Parascedosporium putredinis TaxID=1442378 RepID=A0A9P1H2A5_9PEZI|nr:unnamed protein product [Parascedosporium putredinis]CAI7993795.1 unnamed protein product [Parascedosporium putredinis]
MDGQQKQERHGVPSSGHGPILYIGPRPHMPHFAHTKTPLRMLSKEIILMICQQLCAHCRDRFAFHDANPATIREKRALAYFARTCRTLYKIANPVLYHYFATGNYYSHRMRPADWKPEDDKLVSFTHTVLRYPDLAQHVVSLQVTQSWVLKLTDLKVLPGLYHAIKARGLDPDEYMKSVHDWNGPLRIPSRWWSPQLRTRELAHQQLQELLIMALPRLHTLLASREWMAYFDKLARFRMMGMKLPLEVLCLRNSSSAGPDRVLGLAGDMLLIAPKLHTLFSEGCLDHVRGRERISWEGGPFASFRLRHIMESPDYEELMDALEPSRVALRKVALTWGRIEFEPENARQKTMPHPIRSFQTFSNLHTLVIDQAALAMTRYRRHPTWYDMATFLPATINQLHILFIYQSFACEMQELRDGSVDES